MLIDVISDYKIDLQTGPVKNAGYRIYKKSWQKHRNGRSIKSKNRRPRWKYLGVYETEEAARVEINRLLKTFA